ncbi:MAG: hypothetical protein DHS20C10_11780 [marine bacterium B5-7]|nr:MAG: hypothetical protein DHS20C10_11780 [marine bacterium B5-7]
MNTEQLVAHLRLERNVAIPDLDLAWSAGYEVGLDDAMDDNPFDRGTQAYEYWQAGWDAGQLGEENIFAESQVAPAIETATVPAVMPAEKMSFAERMQAKLMGCSEMAFQLVCVATLTGLGYQLADLAVF